MSRSRNAYGWAIEFNGLIWVPMHPGVTSEMLGFIPSFLSTTDDRSAVHQINTNYLHGGGWRPFKGFKLMEDGALKYPEDPPVRVLWATKLREEQIHFYQHSWVRITQPDGGWEICRLD